MKLFLSPHNDDETLFGAFTIMRERPTVCIMFNSHVQSMRGISGCESAIRCRETLNALRFLTEDENVPVVAENFFGLRDNSCPPAKVVANYLVDAYKGCNVETVWAPAIEINGHDHHNMVGCAAGMAFPGKVTYYLTYTRTRGKSRNGDEVKPRSGDDIARKLRALACYKSQLQMDDRLGCYPHFMNDLKEYYAS